MKSKTIIGLLFIGLVALLCFLQLQSRIRKSSPPNPQLVAAEQTRKPVSVAQPPPVSSLGPLRQSAATSSAVSDVPAKESSAPAPFGEFNDWAVRFAKADAVTQSGLEAEGVALAQARLRALANLIQVDPQQALQNAVPEHLREILPARVQALLEQRLNTRGDLEVFCVTPAEGHPGLPLVRVASINQQQYQIFTYDTGLEIVTRPGVPLNGIAVPASAAPALPKTPTIHPAYLMAMDPRPARVLSSVEWTAYRTGQLTEPRCTVTGQPCSVNGEPTGVALGGTIYPFSSLALAREWADAAVAAENLTQPAAPGNLPTAASSYTEGRKRFMVFRVDFPDYNADNGGRAMSTNDALTLMADLADWMAEVSDGQLTVAPVGEGSDISPLMRLPNDANSYQNMGTFLNACWTEATALGYDKSQYDFWYVNTYGKPDASFAGLGYVGGVGFWLANGYFNVRTCAHEFGHNLGLHHANWWNTGGKSMIGEGSSDEYGDPFDTMGGSGGGIRHFSAYNKNRVDWIPDNDCPLVTSSGTFRVYAHDLGVPTGIRALQFDRPSGGDYWLEFRQLWTSDKALMNGVALRWASGATRLLDFNPGSSEGKDDHPVTIGRTFSDTNINLHLTPIGKGHTYPESMDVVVRIGAFPGNQSPTATATAHPLSGAAGQTITCTAEAVDPDGDALAYFWDFGDGDYSVDNQATTTHVFDSEGDYRLQCIVSDMKGGEAIDTVRVRIGAPATFSISGHIVLTNGLPVPGIKVSVSSSRYAYTQSDGSYLITRLSAGDYTVSATEPIYGELEFITPFFANPVTVGPNFTKADFIALPNAADAYTPLVEKESEWKYRDTGEDLGTAWRDPNFNDGAWAAGPSQLGYGDGDEATVLGFGPDADNKHITYYFRKTINLDNPNSFTNLQLEVMRDDGVIVYLNGTEVFRDNLPAGPITFTDLASSTISGSDESTYLKADIDPGLLVAGANVLAAEIHQAQTDSSDISFDLALNGVSASNAIPANLVFIESPQNKQSFTAPVNVIVNAAALSNGEPIQQVDFYNHGAFLWSDPVGPGFSYWWRLVPTGTHVLTAVATLGSGLQITSPPVQITVRDRQPPLVTQSLVLAGSVWAYFAGPDGPPAGWTERGYDDTAWPAGLAQLGYGENDEATTVPFGGNASDKWITTAFRHVFGVNDPGAVTNLSLQLQRDDGAIVYLNGQEVVRDEMPEGPITAATLANRSVPDDGNDFHYFDLDPALLVNGPNVLAVEIHQASPTSSDISLDAALDAQVAAERAPGIWLRSPANGTTVALPATVELAAEVATEPSRGVARVEYFANHSKIGEAVDAPFRLDWGSPPTGPQQLIAVATDSTGITLTSAPVSITVSAPPARTALISFGAVWKYLDTGVDPAPNWASRTYQDRAWRSGPARLGYGGDGELTTIRSGPVPGQRQVAVYFRREFTLANPGQITGLLLRLIRDDGAVVYLNGVEVFRNNLQPGPVSFNSLATSTVGGGDEVTPVEAILPSGSLVAGVNLVAVEIHQASISSSDTAFDLELTGLSATNTLQGVYLVSPPNGARFLAPAAVPLSAYAKSVLGPITLVEYYEGTVKVGEASAAPYPVTWNRPSLGDHSISAVATYGAGLQFTSAPIAFTVTELPPPILPVAADLIASGSEWAYWDNVTAVEAAWAEPAYDDSAWPVGVARFGWGFDGEFTRITAGRITHYFRRWFTADNPAQLTELDFQLARDDGAVVYLNGREVYRSNMPDGNVTPTTTANGTVNTPDETTYFETLLATAGSGLVAGSNLVAVELHQGSASSSDAGFDLQLQAYGTTEGRIYLTAPRDNVQVRGAAPVAIEALALAPADATIVNVEFYVDGALVGQSQTAPYRMNWSSPAFGTYELVARLTDSRGRVIESEPRAITVSPEILTTTFIPRNAVWKYLDTGVNLGHAWAAPGFNDASWASGPARLGYGNDGEVTRLSFGPSSNNKYITTYFRREFVVPPGAIYTNLMFQLLRDDGAVVWLNGVEAFRSNMPAGTVSYITRAGRAAGGSEEQTFFPTLVPTNSLVSGTNVVAVEVHQANPTSSDLSFNLELTGYGRVDSAEVPSLAVLLDDGHIEVSWPATAVGWQLFALDDPQDPPATWTPVSVAPVTVNQRNIVTVPPAGSQRFFRLMKP